MNNTSEVTKAANFVEKDKKIEAENTTEICEKKESGENTENKPQSKTTETTANSQISNKQISSSNVIERQIFTVDESAEIDATEFVLEKKKKSIIMYNEKILKKSDNMVRFNRKNHSEGNKHILNKEL